MRIMSIMEFMDSSIYVLMAKYIENKATSEECLEFMNALSNSAELREIFCLAVAGVTRLQRPYQRSCRQTGY